MTTQDLIDNSSAEDRRIIVFKNKRQEQIIRNWPRDGSLPSLRAVQVLSSWERLNGFNQNECPVCSKKHVVLRSDDTYCSNACRQKAYRRRVKETKRIASLTGKALRAHQKQQREKQQKLDALRAEIASALHIDSTRAKRNA